MAGIGDRAIGLMSMLGLAGMADNKEEEQATHTMPDGTVMPGATHQGGGDTGSGMGMGIGSALSGISNSFFQGMSQEEVYRMGQGFNTLRFEPDAQMAANFETRIAAMDKDKSSKAARTNAVNALLNMKSEAYPNGRTDLAALVRQGVYSGSDAIKEAIKKTTPSALQEKLAIFSDPENPYNLTDAQRTLGLNNTLGVAVTKSDLENKINLYGEMSAAGSLTPDMKELLGISKPQQSKFDEDYANLTLFAEENGMKPGELADKRLALITGVQPDDGITNKMKEMDYRAMRAGYEPGTDEYKAFFAKFGSGDTIDIDIDTGDAAPEINADYLKKAQEGYVEKDFKQIAAVELAVKNIKKVDQVLGILNSEGAQPNLGYLADFHSTVDRVMADLGLSKEAAQSATYDQRLEALLGSDVFGMINILGIGARGLDTPAERDFLISVMTGTRALTPDALKEMTLYRRKYSRLVVEEYHKRLENGYYTDMNSIRELPRYDWVKPLPAFEPMKIEDGITQSDADSLKLYRVTP